jgi:hypothetical protein
MGAHFAALARIVEHYGPIDGMAGGSSASITTFLYESMRMHPALSTCGAAECTSAQRAERLALLLKSVLGYASEVASSEDAVSVRELAVVGGRIKAEFDRQGIGALLSTDGAEAARRLAAVLSSPDLRSIVSPTALRMLTDSADPAFAAREVYTSAMTLGAFSVPNNRLFFRPAILNFDSAARLFGRVGDFYAGYGPADASGMAALLDACAAGARGRTWDEVAAMAARGAAGDGATVTCGAMFSKLVRAFRDRVRSEEGRYPSRIDEKVGAGSFPKLISTSVLEGPAADAFREAHARYLRGEFPDNAQDPAAAAIPFSVRFEDVKFGYWGADPDLARVASNPMGYDDRKTAKFTSLGDRSWREVLATSPAEPGLAPLVPMHDGRVSAGGWSDLAPVLVLKNMGCERVVYVQREGDESPFAVRIAQELGLKEADYTDLFDLAAPESGYARSVAEADGVWCTNWNSFSDFQFAEMAKDAYDAPLEARQGWSGLSSASPYANVQTRVGRPGCTPGVSGGGRFPR